MGYFCSCAGLCDSRWREDLRTHVLKVNAAYSLNVPLQDICNLRIRVLKVNEAYLLHVLRHGMASVLLAGGGVKSPKHARPRSHGYLFARNREMDRGGSKSSDGAGWKPNGSHKFCVRRFRGGGYPLLCLSLKGGLHIYGGAV